MAEARPGLIIAATLFAGCAAVPATVAVKFRPTASMTEREALGFAGPVASAVEGAGVEDRESWTFDRDGRLIEHIEVNPADHGEMERRERFERDPAGRRIRMIRSVRAFGTIAPVDKVSTVYAYGAGRAPIEEIDVQLPAATATERRVLHYDREGRLHEVWTFGPDSHLKTLRRTLHDDRGLIVEEQLLAPDPDPIQRSLRDTLIHDYPRGFLVLERWRYDYSGRDVRVEAQNVNCDGTSTKSERFDYRGNRIEWRSCDDWIRDSGLHYGPRRRHYRYDGFGNWIEMKDCAGAYRRLDPSVDVAAIDCPCGSLVSRTITYFE